MPLKRDLHIKPGATFNPIFTWKTGKNKHLAQPVDLTGWGGKLTARDKDGVALFECTTDDGSLVLGGEAGTVQPVVSHQDTSAMAGQWEFGTYDCMLYDTDDVAHWFATGRVQLLKSDVVDVP